MTTFYARKISKTSGGGGMLIGSSSADQETLDKLPANVDLRIDAKAPRDGGYHRFYWALLGKIQQNLPESVNLDLEALHSVVKMGAGCTYPVRLPDGTFYELPRSISFSKMDETEFREFMDRAIAFIVTSLIPGMDREVLELEVYDFLAR